MDDEDAMSRLEGLQRDLRVWAESRFANIERLEAELDNSIEELRKLLEKKGRSEESRKLVNPTATPKPDTLTIGDQKWKVTEELREIALQVADELDLDELEAARLCCVESGAETDEQSNGNLTYRVLGRFQQHRFVLLDCVRLLLLQTVDLDAGDGNGLYFQERANLIVRGEGGNPNGASRFWRACIHGLNEIERYLNKVSDHEKMAVMTGLQAAGQVNELLSLERSLLTKQHECLAAIMSYLIRTGQVQLEDFRTLFSKASELEATVDITIHYLPILISGSAYFGSDGTTPLDRAKEFHALFDQNQMRWKQPSFQAAVTVCWLAEYSSRFLDPTSAQILRVADRQKEEEDRSRLFLDSVKDRAFHFILNACRLLCPEIWHDPAKVGLVRFLVEDPPNIAPEITTPSPDFVSLMMGELQAFSDACVTNMPDILRRMQLEEDDRRRAFFSGPPDETQPQDFHLEQFLVIMSYAYQDDAEAAQDFWSDKESNLYGFLTWVSKRLPTPRVAAFCELLRSIAGDEKSGNQAHLFLLEDPMMASGKLRKTYSVSWAQIFSELEVYASTTRDKPAQPQQVSAQNAAPDGNYLEPETYLMLEAYLRLASHICRVSPDARNWIIRGQRFPIHETLFQLASTGSVARVQACCFDLLAALLTDKTADVNDGMWVLLDNWISGGGPAGSAVPRPGRQMHPERRYLDNYAASHDTAAGLVRLLNALVRPSQSQDDSALDGLPFPENLGAPHRHGGIDAYVDFALGTVFRSTGLAEGNAEERKLLEVVRVECLDFTIFCLATFNENLVALANMTNVRVDGAMKTSALSTYARLHPFARVMDWMFNNNVITVLMDTANHNIGYLNSLNSGTPTVQATLKTIQVMHLIMKLQPTYFDIVRPLVASQSTARTQHIANPALASYDEVLLSNLNVVAEIATFAQSIDENLSLESIGLLQKLCGSTRLSESSTRSEGDTARFGGRLVGSLTSYSDAISAGLREYFPISEWDVESERQPSKFVKANAVLDLLNSSLDTSAGRPSVAHALLGFTCHARTVSVDANGLFSQGRSLFHALVSSIAHNACAIGESYISWLMAMKRGSWQVLLKLAQSPLTSSIVLPKLREMEFLSAAAQEQISPFSLSLWDQRHLKDPDLLLNSSASAVRDFLHVRALFFEYAALELRTAIDNRAFSVQDQVIEALLGSIKFPGGEVEAVNSVFDLVDFFDIETADPADLPSPVLLTSDGVAACKKYSPDTVTEYDIPMISQLLEFQKREQINAGHIRDANEEQQLVDMMQGILNAAAVQNSSNAIQEGRMTALEAWVDLLSLMATASSLEPEKLNSVAVQGLLVVLPRFEKALSTNKDDAAMLAKLTLALIPAAGTETTTSPDRNAALTHERLLSAFRICLKGIADSESGLPLRDACYRSCCAVLSYLPLVVVNGKPTPSPSAKQILQLVQASGGRLITVITEDAFSGRGGTRVSALLFLDALMGISQLSHSMTAMLRALTRLNFVPVLIDQSIGSVTSSFQSSDVEELSMTVAYFHTALTLLLRICQTADGAQLVLTSGFLPAVAQSRLFSTDPDIGLDIDNPVALREFYKLLSAVLRVITAIVISGGGSNSTILQQGKTFLQETRFSMQAVFKRTSAVQKTAGPPEKEAMVVAEEFSKLLLVTGFLEDDEPAHAKASRLNGFT